MGGNSSKSMPRVYFLPELALVTLTSVAFVWMTFKRAPFSLRTLMSAIHHVTVPEPTKREKIVAKQSLVHVESSGEANTPSHITHLPLVLESDLPKLAVLSLAPPITSDGARPVPLR